MPQATQHSTLLTWGASEDFWDGSHGKQGKKTALIGEGMNKQSCTTYFGKSWDLQKENHGIFKSWDGKSCFSKVIFKGFGNFPWTSVAEILTICAVKTEGGAPCVMVFPRNLIQILLLFIQGSRLEFSANKSGTFQTWNPKANHQKNGMEMVISNHFLCKDWESSSN